MIDKFQVTVVIFGHKKTTHRLMCGFFLCTALLYSTICNLLTFRAL